MNDEKRASEAATSKGSKLNVSIRKHLYYITFVLCITTIIAGWNIHDLQSGIVTALCGIVTFWLNWIITGGMKG